ncbi:MAG: host attachment protein [Burkholderiales bacterium]|nr:host attachment protein [Burkholderiales bacterium]
MNTWILVANSSHAKIFCNSGMKKGLQLVAELDHPESREKRMDLASDRPGHNKASGNGRGAFVQATDPKQNEADHFALEVAKNLEHGRTINEYERLILVASNPFMGLLKNRLDSHVLDKVSETIEKDYTKSSDKELAAHLEQVIYL